jgi:hypothetical protein
MAQDIFKGTDVEGEPWEAWRPITDDMQKLSACSFVVHVANERCSNRTARALDAANSARLGSFLLSAAGVDIVSAARKVVEARDKMKVAAAQTELPGMMGSEAVRPWLAALDAYTDATQALAAKLAKLDALEGGSA